MGQSKPFTPETVDAAEAVFAALSRFHSHDVLSLKKTLHDVRAYCPTCTHSDDELIEMIVMSAMAHHMAVNFDQHG